MQHDRRVAANDGVLVPGASAGVEGLLLVELARGEGGVRSIRGPGHRRDDGPAMPRVGREVGLHTAAGSTLSGPGADNLTVPRLVRR